MTALTVTQLGVNHAPGAWRCCLADAPDFSATGATVAEAVGALACKYPMALGVEVDLRAWPPKEGEEPAKLLPAWEVASHAATAIRANGHAERAEAAKS